jgi:hypothetical protein
LNSNIKFLLGLKNVSLGRVASGLKGSLYKLSCKSISAVIILQSFERDAIKEHNLELIKLLLGKISAEESIKRTNFLSIVQSEGTLAIGKGIDGVIKTLSNANDGHKDPEAVDVGVISDPLAAVNLVPR